MTELEEYIIEVFKDSMPKIKERVSKINTKCDYITSVFNCDGVFNTVAWDVRKKQFAYIDYKKGIGEGIKFEVMPDMTGFIDDYEIRRIDLTNVML